MRHQSPMFTTCQRRLTRHQRDCCHIERVYLAPWQQLLQSLKTKYDWFSGVGIIILAWEAQEHWHKLWQWDDLMFLQKSNKTINSGIESKFGIKPGRGEGMYFITSWILSESTGWSKWDPNLWQSRKKTFYFMRTDNKITWPWMKAA